MRQGFQKIAASLKRAARPLTAFCTWELRCSFADRQATSVISHLSTNANFGGQSEEIRRS
jgi:hypothetical protein